MTADVREVVACQWMNMGGLLMTNLICFNDVRWNHNWELVHLVEFPPKYWTSNFSPEFFQSQESRVHLQNHATNIFSESAFGQRAFRSTPSHVPNVAGIEISFCFMFMEWVKLNPGSVSEWSRAKGNQLYQYNWWVVSLGMLASRLWRFGASLPVPSPHCLCGRLQEVWLRASPFRNEQPFCPSLTQNCLLLHAQRIHRACLPNVVDSS